MSDKKKVKKYTYTFGEFSGDDEILGALSQH